MTTFFFLLLCLALIFFGLDYWSFSILEKKQRKTNNLKTYLVKSKSHLMFSNGNNFTSDIGCTQRWILCTIYWTYASILCCTFNGLKNDKETDTKKQHKKVKVIQTRSEVHISLSQMATSLLKSFAYLWNIYKCIIPYHNWYNCNVQWKSRRHQDGTACVCIKKKSEEKKWKL